MLSSRLIIAQKLPTLQVLFCIHKSNIIPFYLLMHLLNMKYNDETRFFSISDILTPKMLSLINVAKTIALDPGISRLTCTSLANQAKLLQYTESVIRPSQLVGPICLAVRLRHSCNRFEFRHL